jgi:hypothetical protein
VNTGNIRRFRRVCEHIQSQVCSRRPPPSPRATRKFTTELSESSSCGSDTSERLSPYPGTRQVMYISCRHFYSFNNYRMIFIKLILCIIVLCRFLLVRLPDYGKNTQTVWFLVMGIFILSMQHGLILLLNTTYTATCFGRRTIFRQKHIIS